MPDKPVEKPADKPAQKPADTVADTHEPAKTAPAPKKRPPKVVPVRTVLDELRGKTHAKKE